VVSESEQNDEQVEQKAQQLTPIGAGVAVAAAAAAVVAGALSFRRHR
jgi:hypothetical protein